MCLLDKCRAINQLLQESASYPVDFGEIAGVFRDNLQANVYILNKFGNVLGTAFMGNFDCEVVGSPEQKKSGFSAENIQWMQSAPTTYANFCQIENACVFNPFVHCQYMNKVTAVVPVMGAGQRLGTLVLAKFGEEFTTDDLVLAEVGATVVGMEVLCAQVGNMEDEARKRASVQVALSSLSYSELDAVRHIFEQLGGNEGLLVASKIADRVGITRSVVVNALRKFESAGVIESKSLGVKGTYIRVLNERLLSELAKMK